MTCVGWAAFFCPDHHSVCGLFGYYDEAVRTGIILCRSRLVQYLSIMVTTELAVSGVVVVLMVSAFAVGLTSLAAVRAGAEADTFPPARFYVIRNYVEVNIR